MSLECYIENQIMHWRLTRPERGNALGPSMAKELTKAMESLKVQMATWQALDFVAAEAPCRALVLEAAPSGKKRSVWIAGGDLIELSQLKTAEAGAKYAASLSQFCTDLESLPIPVVAVIDGAAIGGGAELALAADLRFGSPATRFEFKQLTVGLTLGYGSSHRLLQTVGLAQAKRLLFQGRSLTASECLNIGLLTEMAESEQSLTSLLADRLDSLKHLSPKSLALQKQMLHTAAEESYQSSQIKDQESFSSLWMNPTYQKYLALFTRKKN